MNNQKTIELIDFMWDSVMESYKALIVANSNFEKASEEVLVKQREFWNRINESTQTFNNELINTYKNINAQVVSNMKEYGAENLAVELEKIQKQAEELSKKIYPINNQPETVAKENIEKLQNNFEDFYKQFFNQQTDLEKQVQLKFEDVVSKWKEAQALYIDLVEKNYNAFFKKDN
jgi:cytochrome c556